MELKFGPSNPGFGKKWCDLLLGILSSLGNVIKC